MTNYFRRTRQRQMQDGDDTSTAHNAAYAISSFESSNFGEEDTRSYQHVSKTNSKKILRNVSSSVHFTTMSRHINMDNS